MNATDLDIEALEVPDKGILTVTGDMGDPEEEYTLLRDLAERMAPRGILIVRLTPGTTMSELSEDDMREHGWVRA